MEENKNKPGLFEKGGKLGFLHSTVDAFDTFLRVPATVTLKGSHVRDAVDLKRVMIMVVMALVPAALFGMWNVGFQHDLFANDLPTFMGKFWFGFWKVLPLFVVSYVVGLGIEFASAQIKGEEVNEGYLVSGFLIPLIVPVDIPLWMLAVAVAFAVLFGKEVFGGTGMNFLNPALLARAFLFFSYPSKMSGDQAWISGLPDGVSGATPLTHMLDHSGEVATGLENISSQWSVTDLVVGTIPGSVGETSLIAILLGAALLLWTGTCRLDRQCSRHHQCSRLLSAPPWWLRLRYRIHGYRPCNIGSDRMRKMDLRLPYRSTLCCGKTLQPRLCRGYDACHPAYEHLCTSY